MIACLIRELKADVRRRDLWLKVDQFCHLDSLLICHNKKFHTLFSDSESQFLFDISASGAEVLIEVSQEQLTQTQEISVVVQRVEVNREHRLHQTSAEAVVFTSDERRCRSLVFRLHLTSGRYILIPKTAKQVNLMIRAHNATPRIASNSVVVRDWTRKILSKPPAYVTRVVVRSAAQLQKPEHLSCKSDDKHVCVRLTPLTFAGLSPFCRVSLGKQQVRSHVCSSTSNPDFESFAVLFFHHKLSDVVVEVLSQQLLSSVLVGSATVSLAVSHSTAEVRDVDLINRSGSACGSVRLQIETYDDFTKV